MKRSNQMMSRKAINDFFNTRFTVPYMDDSPPPLEPDVPVFPQPDYSYHTGDPPGLRIEKGVIYSEDEDDEPKIRKIPRIDNISNISKWGHINGIYPHDSQNTEHKYCDDVIMTDAMDEDSMDLSYEDNIIEDPDWTPERGDRPW